MSDRGKLVWRVQVLHGPQLDFDRFHEACNWACQHRMRTRIPATSVRITRHRYPGVA